MDTSMVSKVVEKAFEAMIKTTPLVGPVAGVLWDSAKDADAASQSGNLSNLADEAKRQELSLHMAKMQAQVAQEVAIARRIENAVEVEIEEYYEGSGKAGARGSLDLTSASLALDGEGRKVVKRVYRFKGSVTTEPGA